MEYVATTKHNGIEYRATGNTYPEAITNCLTLLRAKNEQTHNGKYYLIGASGQGTKHGCEQTTTEPVPHYRGLNYGRTRANAIRDNEPQSKSQTTILTNGGNVKISLDIRVVRDNATGKKALRVWPEIEGTANNVTAFAVVVVVILTIASLFLIAKTPDPVTHPQQTVQIGGY